MKRTHYRKIRTAETNVSEIGDWVRRTLFAATLVDRQETYPGRHLSYYRYDHRTVEQVGVDTSLPVDQVMDCYIIRLSSGQRFRIIVEEM